MEHIEHIGIAVKSLANSIPLFESLLNCQCYKQEDVPLENVRTGFFQSGETKIELLESTEDTGVIARFIEKRGEGIHHIALAVTDIRAEMARLSKAGFVLLDEQPRRGADGKWVCFLHPKATGGVLIELCQDRDRETRGI